MSSATAASTAAEWIDILSRDGDTPICLMAATIAAHNYGIANVERRADAIRAFWKNAIHDMNRTSRGYTVAIETLTVDEMTALVVATVHYERAISIEREYGATMLRMTDDDDTLHAEGAIAYARDGELTEALDSANLAAQENAAWAPLRDRVLSALRAVPVLDEAGEPMEEIGIEYSPDSTHAACVPDGLHVAVPPAGESHLFQVE